MGGAIGKEEGVRATVHCSGSYKPGSWRRLKFTVQQVKDNVGRIQLVY